MATGALEQATMEEADWPRTTVEAATRAARTGCVLTLGAAASAVPARPRSLSVRSSSAAGTFFTRKLPRANRLPSTLNVSSAAWMSAPLRR